MDADATSTRRRMKMDRTKRKTGGSVLTLDEAIKHCKENVQKETQNGNLQCAIEHNQLAIWLSQLEESKAKAEAYDRLMSGGKKTLKEWANLLGRPVAVDQNTEVTCFGHVPVMCYNRGKGIWTNSPEHYGEEIYLLPTNLIDFDGDWKDSLTLPDEWEVM